MTKVFPKSRICVIDIYPSFERGLKTAINFAKTNNIQLNSADGKRVILGFCIKHIESAYKTTKSSFPKVLCISRNNATKKVQTFIDKHIDFMLKSLPFPYCGKFDLGSPNLESAAENSLSQQKSTRTFNKFASRLKFKTTN